MDIPEGLSEKEGSGSSKSLDEVIEAGEAAKKAQDQTPQEAEAELEAGIEIEGSEALEKQKGEGFSDVIKNTLFELFVGAGVVFLPSVIGSSLPLPPIAITIIGMIILFGHFEETSTMPIAILVAAKLLLGFELLPLYLVLYFVSMFIGGETTSSLFKSKKALLKDLSVDCVKLSTVVKAKSIKIHPNYNKILKMAMDYQMTILKSKGSKAMKEAADKLKKDASKELGVAKKELISVIRKFIMMVGKALMAPVGTGVTAFMFAEPVGWVIDVIEIIIIVVVSIVNKSWNWWSLLILLWPIALIVLGFVIYVIGLCFNVIAFVIEMVIRAVIFVIGTLIKMLTKAAEVAKKASDDPMPKIKKYSDPNDQIRAIYRVYDEGVGKKVGAAFDDVEKQLNDALKDEPEAQEFFAQADGIKSKQMLPGKKYSLLFGMADRFYDSIMGSSQQQEQQ